MLGSGEREINKIILSYKCKQLEDLQSIVYSEKEALELGRPGFKSRVDHIQDL